MTTLRNFWQNFTGQKETEVTATAVAHPTPRPQASAIDLDIAPNDPFLAYCIHSKGVVDLEKLQLGSTAVAAMKQAGVRLVVPLVSQGDLIGLLNLGSRRSEQEYTSDDFKLLQDLSVQAAPALKVAQLVQQQKLEAAERERIQQELKVARLIQQTLLPQKLPDLPGYSVAVHYQPAREVGGDFYDFLPFDDGRQGLIIADVTDKGVPAAMVMATTRSILRAAAERLREPGQVLKRANDMLYPDIPAKMFVTCLYAVLDPAAGLLRYANAGHDLPYRVTAHGVEELRARGMPLGLMPGMEYEEKEIVLQPAESLLLYSDGLVEAHAPDREMFGFPRLQALLAEHPGGEGMIAFLLDRLRQFTGPGWEQEDDVTFVTLERLAAVPAPAEEEAVDQWQRIAQFEVESAPGNERLAVEQVAEQFGQLLDMPASRLEKLKTAVAEATMNAMEHGNEYAADRPVHIEMLRSRAAVAVRITDHGGGQEIPSAEAPDLDAKLAGLQTPRGWGLFLIQNMVDEMNVSSDDSHHTVELVMHVDA